jgi:rubrerythrin
MTIVAGEQQTMNFYMNVGAKAKDVIGRGLYLEIAQIEEQHGTHYESLLDPNCTWFEMLAMHEYNECYLYHSMMEQEVEPRVKKIWQMHLEQELEHLRLAGEAMKKYEKRDPQELFPSAFPKPIIFQSNIDYVRDVLAKQINYNALETEFLPPDKFPHDGRYGAYQSTVNAEEVPSELVIEQHRQKMGGEYRQEIQGQHPIKEYRLQ